MGWTPLKFGEKKEDSDKQTLLALRLVSCHWNAGMGPNWEESKSGEQGGAHVPDGGFCVAQLEHGQGSVGGGKGEVGRQGNCLPVELRRVCPPVVAAAACQ